MVLQTDWSTLSQEKTGAKPNNIGGARSPLKLKSPGARMLHALIQHFNGPSNVGQLVGESLQVVIIWRRRGFVPLKKVGHVSRVLHVPAYLLNYPDVKRFENKGDVPPWEVAVRKSLISSSMKKWVLNAGGF